MNLALIWAVGNANKRLITATLMVLTFIVALPFVAVFSMGTDTLSYLLENDASNSVYAVSTEVQGLYEGPEVKGNTYEWGNCTYWAYALRLKYGSPVPATWGNANTWDDRAKTDGYVIDHTPSVGAIFQTDEGKFGHVAYVKAVDLLSGNWTISEMNVIGLDIVSARTFKADAARYYNFIHDKASSNDVAN